MFCRIRLKDTNYQEVSNYKLLDSSFYDECFEIYRKYCKYKDFDSVIPIFREEFEQNNSDIVGYYDGDRLAAFSLVYRFDSVNSVFADQFAWDYQTPKLYLGKKSLKNECAIYKKLGYDYFYLGEDSDYKSELDGYEVSQFFKTWQN
tara:strand:- start:1876 stop:2316 length:441 start_codon:yes stop_codon:yes gene_type:complete